MRRLPLLLAAMPLLTAAASAPVRPPANPLSAAIARAQAEARTADAEVRRLEQQAAESRDEAARLRAEQAAAAEAIAAAEARISATDAQARLVAAALDRRRAHLREQQRPVSALLGGLVMMAQRPPLLALAGGDTEELVRVRLLLDSTLPVIRGRTAALSRDLAQGERLQQAAADARQALVRSRSELDHKRRRFAELEARAIRRMAERGSAALGAGDQALAAGEEIGRLASEAERSRLGIRSASELASLGPPPPRPGAATGPVPLARLDYRLPATAPVVQGLGAVSANGVRSRGVTLATRRGQPVIVPASGIIRFSGPFRDYDGVVIIDHGGGWTSLIVNAGSELEVGARVTAGAPLGRALGPIGVELSRSGQHWSPALIAGSSAALSNGGKGG